MTRNSIIIILSLLLLAISFCSGIFVHRSWSRSQIHQEQPDTVWVEKEVTILTPLPDKVVSAPADIEPVAIPKEDLKPSADTTVMTVHPEVSTYRDTLPSGASYDIQITGVGTRLDHVHMTWPEATTRVTSEWKGWELSLIGRGMIAGFQPTDMTAGIGIELGYTSGRFSIGAGPGIVWNRLPGYSVHTPHLCMTGTIKIRLHRF